MIIYAIYDSKIGQLVSMQINETKKEAQKELEGIVKTYNAIGWGSNHLIIKKTTTCYCK